MISWKPRARIPRSHQTPLIKVHTILSYSIITFCFIYILGIAGLSLGEKNDNLSPQHSVAILIDTSLSMSAADIKPNRYAQALSIATGLIESYNAQYITIPYGAIPFIRTPFSVDTFGVEKVLSQYSLGSHHVNDAYMGSAPGNAIGLAWAKLVKTASPRKTILLLGDGNTNTGYTIDTFIPYLQQNNIQLIICAIGVSGYQLGTSYGNRPIISSLDVARLDYITQQTQGKWRVCNNVDEAIERITMRFKDDILLDDDGENFSFITMMRDNQHLRLIVLGGILYIIITTARTYLRYEVAIKKQRKIY